MFGRAGGARIFSAFLIFFKNGENFAKESKTEVLKVIYRSFNGSQN